MKPNEIFDIMDLARRARAKGKTFNPMFVGAPGLGKSEIVQQWCKLNNLPFIDVRNAYLESPDFVGFPKVVERDGRSVTTYAVPDTWPDGDKQPEGVLFFDEVNRGTNAVMNCMMQILTDRKIRDYTLPDKWLIVSAINPETAEFDVNTMDFALRDRFEMFNIEYDKRAFIKYMKASEFDQTVIHFVETGTFRYVAPEDVGTIKGAKYISPRTISKLNAALCAELPEKLENTVYESILGKNVGISFYSFKHNELPVTAKDIKTNPRESLARLKAFSDPKSYKMGHISITIKDIVENDEELTQDELINVALVMPADQAFTLFSELEFKTKDNTLVEKLTKKSSALRKHFKENLTEK